MNRRKLISLSIWMISTIPAYADFLDDPAPVAPPAPARPQPTLPSAQGAPEQPPTAPNNTTRPRTGTPRRETGASSQPRSSLDHNTAAPITYKADSATGSSKNGYIELVKNVIIKQDDTTMWANKANLYTAPGSTTPRRVVAKGKVKLKKLATAQSAEINATADEIEYFADTQKAILSGRPVLQKGKEVLKGEQIEVDLVTESIKVRNPSGVMDPKSNENLAPQKSGANRK